jgi:hypothetical protein
VRRRRVNWNGPALALLTLVGLLAVAALALGAMAGSRACVEALALLAGIAAFVCRGAVGDRAANSVSRGFGGTGMWAGQIARVTITVWGVLAVAAGGVALLIRLFDLVA